MKIPYEFNLGAHKITVRKNLRLKDCYGEWFTYKKEIQLARPKKDWSEFFAFQVFVHEAVHAVLETMGRQDLSENEAFVDGLSEAITQVILTSKFEEPTDVT
jgi:hypothetical protein